MEQSELSKIGYKTHYYGEDLDSNAKQCFHCKYGKTMESNREKILCNRWKMICNEDDICNYFDFADFWAFNYSDEDKERRKNKLESAKNKFRE